MITAVENVATRGERRGTWPEELFLASRSAFVLPAQTGNGRLVFLFLFSPPFFVIFLESDTRCEDDFGDGIMYRIKYIYKRLLRTHIHLSYFFRFYQ